MKFATCGFIYLLIINDILCQNILTKFHEEKRTERLKRESFLEYLSLTDFTWLHRLLEMVFGELYTEFLAATHAERTETSTFPPTFEAALKPWIKNITSPRPTFRPPVTLPNLPYPHIFTTPRPNRKASTTPAPPTTTEKEDDSTINFFDKLTAAFTENEELLASMNLFGNQKSPFFSSKSVGPAAETVKVEISKAENSKVENGKSICDKCQAGKTCTAKLNSFETTDPVFKYAYEHGSVLNEMLDYVMKLPPPLTWKDSATPEVVQLTMNLMNLYRPNRSLVIGVFTGLALIGISSVTDSRGIVVGLEYPDHVHYWEKIGIKHAQRAGIMNRIQIRSIEGIERSLQKLAAYEPNAFDFVFLDDLKKSNYLDDYEHSVRLLRNGGLLIITDALYDGAVLNGSDHISPEAKVVQAMNSRIKSDPRVVASLLPFGGGTWVVVRK